MKKIKMMQSFSAELLLVHDNDMTINNLFHYLPLPDVSRSALIRMQNKKVSYTSFMSPQQSPFKSAKPQEEHYSVKTIRLTAYLVSLTDRCLSSVGT